MTLFPERRVAPQFIEEAHEHHDLVILLGRFYGFHRRQHDHVLAIQSQIPRRCAGLSGWIGVIAPRLEPVFEYPPVPPQAYCSSALNP